MSFDDTLHPDLRLDRYVMSGQKTLYLFSVPKCHHKDSVFHSLESFVSFVLRYVLLDCVIYWCKKIFRYRKIERKILILNTISSDSDIRIQKSALKKFFPLNFNDDSTYFIFREKLFNRKKMSCTFTLIPAINSFPVHEAGLKYEPALGEPLEIVICKW